MGEPQRISHGTCTIPTTTECQWCYEELNDSNRYILRCGHFLCTDCSQVLETDPISCSVCGASEPSRRLNPSVSQSESAANSQERVAALSQPSQPQILLNIQEKEGSILRPISVEDQPPASFSPREDISNSVQTTSPTDSLERTCEVSGCTKNTNSRCGDCKRYFCSTCQEQHQKYSSCSPLLVRTQPVSPITEEKPNDLLFCKLCKKPTSNQCIANTHETMNLQQFITESEKEIISTMLQQHPHINKTRKARTALQTGRENLKTIEKQHQELRYKIDCVKKQQQFSLGIAYGELSHILTSVDQLCKKKKRNQLEVKLRKLTDNIKNISFLFNETVYSCTTHLDPPCTITDFKKLILEQQRVEIPRFGDWEDEWIISKKRFRELYRLDKKILYFTSEGCVGVANRKDLGEWKKKQFVPSQLHKFIFSPLSESQ